VGLLAMDVTLAVGALLGVVAFTLLIGRPIIHLALRWSARTPGSGPTIAIVVVLVVLSSAGTQALGLEAVLGAFLCGIVIGSSGKIDQSRLDPLRTLVMAVLAPLFFATVGLRMDLSALREPAVLGSAVVVLLVAIGGKFTGAYAGARIGRLGHWEALALGSGLNARGDIQIIVAMVGLRLRILSTAAYTIVILIAIVTSLMAPPMLRYAVARADRESAARTPALENQGVPT
jgi:Kef-type K+ transport system membrane component KefB